MLAYHCKNHALDFNVLAYVYFTYFNRIQIKNNNNNDSNNNNVLLTYVYKIDSNFDDNVILHLLLN